MSKKIVFIGGGPAGYEGAIRASQLGADVTIIEKEHIGGVCMNKGCIPTKAMYKNAEVITHGREGETYGLEIDSFKVNFKKIMERKDSVVAQLREGTEKLMKDYNIEVIKGVATFKDEKTLEVKKNDGETIEVTGDSIIIATGSKPFMPNVEGIDHEKVIDSDQLLELEEMPKRLVIAGGGVIGLEFAYIFNAFGSEVSIISNNLVKRMDSKISKRIKPVVKKLGINFVSKSHLKMVEEKDGELIVHTEGKRGDKEVKGDMLLVAIGRVPLIDGLNLDKVGIEYDKNGIKVDERFETNLKDVYAVGDVIGGKMLAHLSSHQAIETVEIILGERDKKTDKPVPDCVFMNPQLASAGKTEEQLKEEGADYITGEFNFMANGKAVAMNEGDGFVKILADRETHKVLGVHIVGPHASDIIHEGVLAITEGMEVEKLGEMIHAHPTLAEAVLEASLDTLNRAIHLSPK
jgi:dihydrolipoamide dehydrogenase